MLLNAAPSFELINKDSWNELPNDIKSVIDDMSVEMARFYYDLANDPELVKTMHNAYAESGVEIIEFSPVERAKLVAVAPEVWESWIEKNGGEVARQTLAAYLATKKKVEAEYPEGLK